MSDSNTDGDSDREVPKFISADTNRDGLTVSVTIDEDEFRKAVRQEVHLYLQEQLRNPRDSQLLDLIGKFVESWLASRSRRRRSD